jgi:hypothetical protein
MTVALYEDKRITDKYIEECTSYNKWPSKGNEENRSPRCKFKNNCGYKPDVYPGEAVQYTE